MVVEPWNPVVYFFIALEDGLISLAFPEIKNDHRILPTMSRPWTVVASGTLSSSTWSREPTFAVSAVGSLHKPYQWTVKLKLSIHFSLMKSQAIQNLSQHNHHHHHHHHHPPEKNLWYISAWTSSHSRKSKPLFLGAFRLEEPTPHMPWLGRPNVSQEVSDISPRIDLSSKSWT